MQGGKLPAQFCILFLAVFCERILTNSVVQSACISKKLTQGLNHYLEAGTYFGVRIFLRQTMLGAIYALREMNI